MVLAHSVPSARISWQILGVFNCPSPCPSPGPSVPCVGRTSLKSQPRGAGTLRIVPPRRLGSAWNVPSRTAGLSNATGSWKGVPYHEWNPSPDQGDRQGEPGPGIAGGYVRHQEYLSPWIPVTGFPGVFVCQENLSRAQVLGALSLRRKYMNKFNGSCRTRRSPAPRSPDWLVTLQTLLDRAEHETYDAETARMVEDFRRQEIAEGYYYTEN